MTLRWVALASLVVNVVLVFTGGAVRLTGSGLGCPTWPKCTNSSYVTTSAMGYHGVIEFSNRIFGVLVGILVVVAVLLALLQPVRDRRQIGWSVAMLMTIPAQAVVGGITVLTKLNPWVVACHFLFSMVIIVVAYRMWLATREPGGPVRWLISAPVRALNWLLLVVTAVVLAAGTVVTGSGPHAGDATAHRTGLDPGMVAQLHADLVMLLIGLSVAWCFALWAIGAPRQTRRAGVVLVGVELAQGVIGFVQYFTHLPSLLVAVHLIGACAVWLAALRTQSAGRVREPEAAAEAVPAPTLPAAASAR
ncbi:COX15/CtaA family protein [Rugosimonospora acidiphila]|uniref:COX15/CtaA family protein n=1 Tax=Rugosimonospora acidiphila TaxID=556531 RepID=UPI0031E56531